VGTAYPCFKLGQRAVDDLHARYVSAPSVAPSPPPPPPPLLTCAAGFSQRCRTLLCSKRCRGFCRSLGATSAAASTTTFSTKQTAFCTEGVAEGRRCRGNKYWRCRGNKNFGVVCCCLRKITAHGKRKGRGVARELLDLAPRFGVSVQYKLETAQPRRIVIPKGRVRAEPGKTAALRTKKCPSLWRSPSKPASRCRP
jgi:hypothetical protein